MGCGCSLGKLPGKRGRCGSCPPGCKLFEKIPVGGYYQGCGPRVRARLARGEPATAYEKVSDKPRGDAVGGAVEFLLKGRGWGEKSAPYYPVRACQCVQYLGPHGSDIARRKAIQLAERYAEWKLGDRRIRRVA